MSHRKCQCGKVVKDSHKFCPFCGVRVADSPIGGLHQRATGKHVDKGFAKRSVEGLTLFGVRLAEKDEKKARQ